MLNFKLHFLGPLIFSMFSSIFAGQKLPNGFVYLKDVDPTIKVSMRYIGNENFLGCPVDGYKKAKIIMTRQAAKALKKVQATVKKDGYCLVVYDAYRPQHAVNHFVRWGKDQTDVKKKKHYYPYIDKATVFEKRYIMTRSSHSRGSTVDLTLIKSGNKIHAIKSSKRTLTDGRIVSFLDDGTVDMGSSFDLFDKASHTKTTLIKQKHQDLRAYINRVMSAEGFKVMGDEWWHFTLKNEPNPKTYFDFPIA